jgi:hypothetical protein
MADDNPGKAIPSRLLTFTVIAVLAMVFYEIYSGVALKKIGVPGVLDIELGERASPAAAIANPPALPPQSAAVSQPAIVSQPAPVMPAAPRPAVSRDGFGGKWRVDQTVGGVSSETVVDYRGDGTFGGWMTRFVGGIGQRVPVEGRWDVDVLTSDTFRLKLTFSNFTQMQETFKVLDPDHVQNLEENYVK